MDEEVGEDVVGDVDDDDTWPCVVLDRHMGPVELAAIFSRTAINIHVSVAISYLGFFFPTPSRPGSSHVFSNGSLLAKKMTVALMIL